MVRSRALPCLLGLMFVGIAVLVPLAGAATPLSLAHAGGGVVFTFNAGYASALAAADLLEARGIHATFYIVSGQLRQGPYYTDYLSATDVANLSARGHDIGSMTVTQVDLTTVSASRLNDELANSQLALQAITGRPVTQLAYPGGAVNANVALAAETRYASGRTVTTSVSDFQPVVDAYALPGLLITRSTTLAAAKSYVDEAAARGVFVVLSFDRIISTPGTYDWTPTDLAALADYVRSKSVATVTVAQLVSGTPPPPPGVPEAPALVASAGNANVGLSWSTPANGGSAITSYHVYRGTASGASTLYRTLGVVNAFADVNVTNGVSYFYRVSAANAQGEGALSSEKSATPQAPPAAGKGTIVFTFDDGTPDHVSAAQTLLSRGFRGTFYVISNCAASETGGSCLTSTQVKGLSQAGHDVESHTVRHRDLVTLTASGLTTELASSQATLQSLTGKPVRHLAYPYGSHDARVEDRTAAYYTTGRIYLTNPAVSQLPTLIAQSGSDPYVVPGIGVTLATSLARAKSYVDHAVSQNATIVLTFHEIVNGGDAYSWRPADFRAFVDYVATTGVSVKTIAEAYP